MAVGGGSVGVEAFKDDAEAIKAIRLFPDVMMSFGGLGPDATDAEITQKFLPALKVMLPHGGYFHDTRTPVAHRTMDLATNTARAHSHHRTFRLPFHGLWFGLWWSSVQHKGVGCKHHHLHHGRHAAHGATVRRSMGRAEGRHVGLHDDARPPRQGRDGSARRREVGVAQAGDCVLAGAMISYSSYWLTVPGWTMQFT